MLISDYFLFQNDPIKTDVSVQLAHRLQKKKISAPVTKRHSSGGFTHLKVCINAHNVHVTSPANKNINTHSKYYAKCII